jgi:hypothetical protein
MPLAPRSRSTRSGDYHREEGINADLSHTDLESGQLPTPRTLKEKKRKEKREKRKKE